MDPATGMPVGQLTDKRPSSRSRNSLLASSAYHFSRDILYSSYRYYWELLQRARSTGMPVPADAQQRFFN